MLDVHTTGRLLQFFSPRLVFSGDDHDQCEYTHEFPTREGRRAKEYTLGTFSWMQGNRLPSYGLLTVTRTAHHFQVCMLPDQLGNYVSYAVLLGLTLVWTAFAPCVYHWARRKSVRPSSPVVFDVDKLTATQLTLSEIVRMPHIAAGLTAVYLAFVAYYYLW